MTMLEKRRSKWGRLNGALMVMVFGAAWMPACDGNGDTHGNNPAANVGKPCTQTTDCGEGGVCVSIGGNQQVCSTACASSKDCLSGWICDAALAACACSSSPESCNGKDDDCNGLVDDRPRGEVSCQAQESDLCLDYSTFDGMSPAVSFKADVLPIFRGSFGVSTACHANEAGQQGQPYLGPPISDPDPTAAQITEIITQIVSVAAVKAPTMSRVDPGKPETSFLMHKMDATLTCAIVTCGPSCGSPMPVASASLPIDQRDLVRRWIAQGAKND
jgi:hypothetical protein